MADEHRCVDGTAVLATSEDRKLRIFDTSVSPFPYATLLSYLRPSDSPVSSALLPRTFQQPDAIHSTLWYPTASLSSPETFCFIASVRDTPVRLLDAQDGHVSRWILNQAQAN